MKIAVFGPDRCVGALVDRNLLDLNHGLARILQKQGQTDWEKRAAAELPPGLLSFIEAGSTALQAARRVLDQFGKILIRSRPSA